MPAYRETPVLVVDDVLLIIEVVRTVLGQLGFRDVDAARDGSDALVRMHKRRYGLVISDWNMDQVTGYELLRRVRADPDLRETPFLMMTTKEQAHCFEAARRAGVNGCLIKPFSPAALRKAIEDVWPADHFPTGSSSVSATSLL
ncbi:MULTISPECIES: response regulator [unclassified Methylobacterium]|uniref:response regulator n=1 Tax=unclassified Methylobacterium TaxID=2615210 RepID=UPI002269E80E|nr:MULTISPECIES: response regulator [unclassified Methylobacterium]